MNSTLYLIAYLVLGVILIFGQKMSQITIPLFCIVNFFVIKSMLTDAQILKNYPSIINLRVGLLFVAYASLAIGVVLMVCLIYMRFPL
jgi:hypothetical protein